MLDAEINCPVGRLRQGKINYDVGLGGKVIGYRHVYLRDACQDACVFAEVGVFRFFNGAYNLESPVLNGKGKDSPSHPAGRAAYDKF